MSAVAAADAGTGASPVVVEARGLVKRFGGFTAVNEIDIEVPTAHITAMIGPNGAGKSTVINLLSGAMLPTAGTVRIHGQQVVGHSPHSLARLGLARTFQTPKLFEGLTTLESMMLPRALFAKGGLLNSVARTPRMRRDESDAVRSAMGWLDFVGLQDAAERPMNALPVGSQRLVEVARAMATEPDAILLDEPAAGLDHTETARLARLIKEIAQSGVGVLLVEHDMHLVMSVADTVVVLDAGSRIAVGTPQEVRANPTVIDAYLGVVRDRTAGA